MTKQKHVHKFRRHRHKTGNSIFFCALPDCTYKINTALALGKRAICWICGNEFLMNEYSLRLAKPHCESCHKPKKLENKTLEEQSQENRTFDDEVKLGPSIFGITEEINPKMTEQEETENKEMYKEMYKEMEDEEI